MTYLTRAWYLRPLSELEAAALAVHSFPVLCEAAAFDAYRQTPLATGLEERIPPEVEVMQINPGYCLAVIGLWTEAGLAFVFQLDGEAWLAVDGPVYAA